MSAVRTSGASACWSLRRARNQSCLYGAGWNFERLRGLFDRDAFDFVEHEHGAEILRQVADRALEDRAQLFARRFGFGAGRLRALG